MYLMQRRFDGLADKLRKMLTTAFQPQRSMYHYLLMARGNYLEYLKCEFVRLRNFPWRQVANLRQDRK